MRVRSSFTLQAPEVLADDQYWDEEGVLWTIEVNPNASVEHAVQFKGVPQDDGAIRWRRQNWPPSKKMGLAMEQWLTA